MLCCLDYNQISECLIKAASIEKTRRDLARRIRRTFPLAWALLLLVSSLMIQSVAGYPYTPTYPYGQPPNIIVVHTTTIIYSGPPITNFNFSIVNLDSLSLISSLNFTTASPLTNFVIQIFQLNTVPLSIAAPNGKTLLIFQFNLVPGVEQNITSAQYIIRVPQTELLEFSVPFNTLQVSRFTFSSHLWAPITILNSEDAATYVYLTAFTPGLSLYAVTGVQSHGITILTFLALLTTIAASGTLFLARRRNHGRIET